MPRLISPYVCRKDVINTCCCVQSKLQKGVRKEVAIEGKRTKKQTVKESKETNEERAGQHWSDTLIFLSEVILDIKKGNSYSGKIRSLPPQLTMNSTTAQKYHSFTTIDSRASEHEC